MSLERLQPAGHVKTLEDTVREMLKPLLVQWLNENMPRIINDALREEIASSGLVPRLDNERR
jgi:cell pole-organizing protein PopZ